MSEIVYFPQTEEFKNLQEEAANFIIENNHAEYEIYSKGLIESGEAIPISSTEDTFEYYYKRALAVARKYDWVLTRPYIREDGATVTCTLHSGKNLGPLRDIL
jgi:hypothetical protein